MAQFNYSTVNIEQVTATLPIDLQSPSRSKPPDSVKHIPQRIKERCFQFGSTPNCTPALMNNRVSLKQIKVDIKVTRIHWLSGWPCTARVGGSIPVSV